MGDAVIMSAVRTPIADARKGGLATVSVHDLAKASVVEALKRSGVAVEDVDDLILGEVMQGGGCIARYVANDLGLPPDLPGMAVNRACASGLSAVNTAAAGIRAGMDRVVIAGGVESMTQTPATYQRSPLPWGGMTPWISPTHPDSPEAPNLNMGITVGENTAEQCGITREDQDAWAYRSHRRAVAAIDEGRFADELVAVQVPGRRGEVSVVDTDEHPRRDTTPEKLAALPALFKAGGTVTAGNSSSLNDGSCAVVLTDSAYAAEHDIAPLAVVRSWTSVGVPPRETGIAPTLAIPRALRRAGLHLDDLALVEINEAFASMAVACTRVLGLDPGIVNVNGGAVGLGHPVACSGARILTTLVHELRRRGGGYGLASLCAGGGMGAATVVEVLPPG
ncbi:MAG: thiolase family protein [Actinomycetota bacterium]|nr:thiolase family protein [Actinomycetota bacterium]